jgi:TRAP-type C4-dicarboxylate transport system permease small subunit
MLIIALPRGPARALVLFGLLLGLAVTAVIAVFATRVTLIKFAENEYDFFKLAWMPIWVVYAVIPFGAALWFVQLCRDAVTALTDLRAVPSARRLED